MLKMIKKTNPPNNSLVKSFDELLREPTVRDFWLPYVPRDPFKVDKSSIALPTDIYRDGDNIVVKTEVAGISKENIEISYEDGNIKISATKNHEIKNDKESYREITYGKLTRSFSIRENVDFDNSTATIKDGILTISLPLTIEASKKKTIRITD